MRINKKLKGTHNKNLILLITHLNYKFHLDNQKIQLRHYIMKANIFKKLNKTI